MKKIHKLMSCLLVGILLTACAPASTEEPPISTDNDTKIDHEDKAYEYSGETQAQVNNRIFTLEDIPESIPEELVVNSYYFNIVGEYDKLKELYGNNEALQISADNEKKNFEDGQYVREYTIHTLDTLHENDVLDTLYNQLAIDIEKYELHETVIIKADIDLIWPDTVIGAQLPSGEYVRLFLCGKKNSEDSWKIYEVYWGEMLGY